MTTSARLGGFKVLKDVARISLVLPNKTDESPAKLTRLIMKGKINLPYFTCMHDGGLWGVNMAAESLDEGRLISLIAEAYGNSFILAPKSAILSIFPHRKNPEVPGSLLSVFGKRGLEAEALANSPSAISVVLRSKSLGPASDALFEPFSFSAYRTPADWKLAQKGKEELYKEVVASYQEKRPKVYGLEYHEHQALMKVPLKDSIDIGRLGSCFKEFAGLDLNLTFLTTCPSSDREVLAFCLPYSEEKTIARILEEAVPDSELKCIAPAAVFSMNGPHFGDRHGIANELLTALEKSGVELLGLNCTIASITAVVRSPQMQQTVEAIQTCFEVPTVIKKSNKRQRKIL